MIRILFAFLLIATLPATAQDKPQRAISSPFLEPEAPQETQTVPVTPAEDTSVTFSPESCDFEITFPEAPYSSRRCPDNANGQCYSLTSYTMVYSMATTVDVSVTCNPVTPSQYEGYNEGVMRIALEAMAPNSQVVNYSVNYSQEENDVRRATLSGTGAQGRQEKIYTAQIWLSPKSMMTIEAELIGGEHPDADTTFSEILKSIKFKTPEKETTEAPAAEPADAPAQP